jgi:hypothetical protein
MDWNCYRLKESHVGFRFSAPKPQPEEGGPSYLLAECWGRFSFRCRQVCCVLKETAPAGKAGAVRDMRQSISAV